MIFTTKIDSGAGSISTLEPSPKVLEERVRALALPRDFYAQPRENRQTREHIADLLSSLGYRVTTVGEFKNVLALPSDLSSPVPLVCAHLDSVPTTPGADDNASGLAVLIETARAAAAAGQPVAFLAPNAEEHDLAGSREFVGDHVNQPTFGIRGVHVLEMVGFATSAANSQSAPAGGRLLRMPTVADFLALAANHGSMGELKHVLREARALDTTPRVIALRAYFGTERLFPDIYRSDHAPFWFAGIPAILWTDTAEFRNEHYHRQTDTPDTLNYQFMAQVASLLIGSLLHRRKTLSKKERPRHMSRAS